MNYPEQPEKPLSTAGHLAALLVECDFDVAAYEQNYPDLMLLSGDITLIVDHLLEFGVHEGRNIQFKSEIDGLIRFLSGLKSLPPHAHFAIARCAALGWVHYQTPERSSRQEEWAKFDLLARSFEASGYSAFVIVGDSHSLAYVSDHFVANGLVPLWALCSGGSARGLNNPTSRSGYGEAIIKSLAALSAPIVVHFGQVDVEFVYFFQANLIENSEINLIDFINYEKDCQIRYQKFLVKLLDCVNGEIIVSGIFPSAMSDEHINTASLNAHIAFLHSEHEFNALTERIRGIVFPDIRIRTALNFTMNVGLEAMARRSGFKFVDVFQDLLCERGTVNDRFNLAAGTDHHLTFGFVSEILAPRAAATIGSRRLDHLAENNAADA